MKIYYKCQKFLWAGILLVSLSLLVGCSPFGSTGDVSNTSTSSRGRTTSPTVVSNANVGRNRPGTGPVIIQSPTHVPGGSASSQQVGMVDRMLIIESVNRYGNTTTGMTTVTIKATIKNTSHKDIDNLATYYQIVGAEGDMFGLPPNTNNSFFGTIASGSMRSGTLIFQQIPTVAIKKLQLLYHSAPAQVVFVPLNA